MHFECVDGKLEKPPVGRSYQQQHHHHRAPPRAARRHSTWTRRVFLRRQSTHEIAKLVYALHNTLISHFRKFRRRAKIGESENSIGKYIYIFRARRKCYIENALLNELCAVIQSVYVLFIYFSCSYFISRFTIFSVFATPFEDQMRLARFYRYGNENGRNGSWSENLKTKRQTLKLSCRLAWFTWIHSNGQIIFVSFGCFTWNGMQLEETTGMEYNDNSISLRENADGPLNQQPYEVIIHQCLTLCKRPGPRARVCVW